MSNSFPLKPGWTPLSTGLMVLGFVAYWPLGLAMLAYILWGDRMTSAWQNVRPNMQRMARDAGLSRPDFGRTGNSAFDEYRHREMKRLEEERAALERMREEFDEFLHNLRKAKDQEEFDRFMAARDRPAA
jgi:hypothetical protein